MAIIERSLRVEPSFTARSKTGVSILLRPPTREDEVDLHDGLVTLSSGLLGLQLFPDAPRPQDRDLAYLTSADFVTHAAWVAIPLNGKRQEAVGVGRWRRIDDNPDVALASVAVDEDWRYEGIGTALLTLVVQSAADHDISSLRIPLWVSASVMRPQLEKLGARFGSWEGGRMDVDLDLPAPGSALSEMQTRVGLEEHVLSIG